MIFVFQMYEYSSGVTLLTEDRTAVMEDRGPVKKWVGYGTMNLYVMIKREESLAWRGVLIHAVSCGVPRPSVFKKLILCNRWSILVFSGQKKKISVACKILTRRSGAACPAIRSVCIVHKYVETSIVKYRAD